MADSSSKYATAAKGAAPAVAGGIFAGPIGAAGGAIAADKLMDGRKAPYLAGGAAVAGALLLSGGGAGAVSGTSARGVK